MTLVTKHSLEQMLSVASNEKKQQIIGRACVAIFQKQTSAEKTTNSTNTDNGVGFTSSDAHTGSLTAKYFMKHNSLQDWQVNMWMKLNSKGTFRISKYWKQLNDAAEIKASIVNKC